HITSTIKPQEKPLYPPEGAMVPSRPFFGSTVGRPSLSRAQPSGMSLPSSAACFTVLQATAEEDWSIRNAILPDLPGTAKDMGLVPSTGVRPPTGAILADELVKPKANRPARARVAV